MIEVEHLTKNYGQISAISDVSFTVNRGEILGFLGPNGAGKTTTMRILTCFIPATSGSARVAGFDVFTQSLEVRRRIGYLPERVPLYGEMEVDAYLEFVARMKGVPARDRKRAIEEVKDKCGIRDISGRLVAKLSRGYAQRVGIAQALLNEPEVLILDEPTVGLDPNQIVEIRNLIKSLAGKRTIILSTHILPEVSMICDSVAIINEGRIVARDSLSSLEADRQMKLHLLVRGPDADVLQALAAIEGVETAERTGSEDQCVRVRVALKPRVDAREMIAAEIVRRGWGLVELRPDRASLEDIFLRATAKEAEVTS
ncbi:MAG: ATP-binding cassette domain-containing protein [Candidatus Abyssobacteria bacterium SURF_5]|uniref:ATP-binding cassette domain-containing protein n=1 Tax=Abyssobacteria bacterium (strain SURF_5) TaxID=2093360 RepID=A0A3A4NUE8_ABYX5|nr:MAG: ATP-binding cassette domain-containing protein [Candidatus Abyssubacteria bacterium SURF_5]